MLTPSLEGLVQDQEVVFRARFVSKPTTRYGKNKRPTTRVRVLLHTGEQVMMRAFEDSKPLEAQWTGKWFVLVARVNIWNDELTLNARHFFDGKWSGKSVPIYPGKPRVVSADSAGELVQSMLDTAIPHCETAIQETLQGYLSMSDTLRIIESRGCKTIGEILRAAHQPRHALEAADAIHSLKRLAALCIMVEIERERSSKKAKPIIVSEDSIRRHVSMVPFDMTAEQQGVSRDVLRDWGMSNASHRVISGDVATGKTVVFAVAAAAAAEAGAKIFIMTYNIGLVHQIASEVREMFPHIEVTTVAGDDKETPALPKGGSIVVGTSALTHRINALGKPDAVIVDEQQRFQPRQIQKLTDHGAHLVEATATCIPRTQALIEFGIMNRSTLTIRHSKRFIETSIYTGADKAMLGKGVIETLERGNQVLVVFPRLSASEDDRGSDFRLDHSDGATAKTGNPEVELMSRYPEWERRFPGQVVCIHGKLKGEEKIEAIERLKSGDAKIGLATTAVEVGLTAPKLERVVIIGGDRFGLGQLHQLRGRAARKMEFGYCDVYLPNDVSDETMERLRAFQSTDNGWELAAMDMRQRGFGDLTKIASKQSGQAATLLFHHSLTFDLVESVAEEYQKARTAAVANHNTAATM
jgi:ATP-dependent DNA helicase RecG